MEMKRKRKQNKKSARNKYCRPLRIYIVSCAMQHVGDDGEMMDEQIKEKK